MATWNWFAIQPITTIEPTRCSEWFPLKKKKNDEKKNEKKKETKIWGKKTAASIFTGQVALNSEICLVYTPLCFFVKYEEWHSDMSYRQGPPRQTPRQTWMTQKRSPLSAEATIQHERTKFSSVAASSLSIREKRCPVSAGAAIHRSLLLFSTHETIEVSFKLQSAIFMY